MAATDNEFAKGWPVVLAGLIGNGLCSGTIGLFTIGIFGPELGREFHWTSGQITSGLLINTLVVMMTVPIAGMLCDRFGVRPVVLCSTALVVPAYMSFALINGSFWTYLLAWIVLGVVGAGTFPPNWSRAINSRFQVHKGFALGIALCGTGISGALLKPFGFMAVAHGGWRFGYVALGSLSLISFVTALVLVPNVKKERSAAAAAGLDRPDAAGPALGVALRQWRFWVLALAIGAAAIAMSGPLASVESILKELKFPRQQIISLASLMGLSMIVGRFGSSYLVDRVWAPLVGLTMVAASTGGMLVLSWSQPSVASTAISLILMGAATGMELDLAAFLVARYFGSRHYAGIYGAVYAVFSLFTGSGAVLFAVAHDHLGGYRHVLPIGAVMLLCSGLLLPLLGKYVYPSGGARAPRPSEPSPILTDSLKQSFTPGNPS
jgi:predicted MFS family arabinose efflux permease